MNTFSMAAISPGHASDIRSLTPLSPLLLRLLKNSIQLVSDSEFALYSIKVHYGTTSLFYWAKDLQKVYQCDGDLFDYYPEEVHHGVTNYTSGNGLIVDTDELNNWFHLQNPSSLVSVSGISFTQPITTAKNAFKDLTNIEWFSFNTPMDCSQLEYGNSMFENFGLNHGASVEWLENLVQLPTYSLSTTSVLKETSNMFKNCKGFNHIGRYAGTPLAIGQTSSGGMFQGATTQNLAIGFTTDQMTSEKTTGMFGGLYYESLSLANDAGAYEMLLTVGLNNAGGQIKELYITSSEVGYDFHPASLDSTVSCLNSAMNLYLQIKTWEITSRC